MQLLLIKIGSQGTTKVRYPRQSVHSDIESFKGLEVYHHIVHQYAFLNPGMREYTLG